MTDRKAWLLRIGVGGAMGVALLLPLGSLFNDLVNGGLLRMGGSFEPVWISPDLIRRTGSAPLALTLQLLLYFAFGGAVGVATLPFAEAGRTLLARSLAHFAVTAGIFSLLLWLCGWAFSGQALLFCLALLAAVYVLVWLGRWMGWYAEVTELRARLGLTAGPSPLKWRETLPYLPFVLLMCLLLPALLRWIDHAVVVDTLLFSGLFYPFLFLPTAALCSAFALGRREGFCPLYPLLCLVCCLPSVFLLFNHTALFHCLVAGAAALLGNGLGALWRRCACR